MTLRTMRLECADFWVDVRLANFHGRWVASADTPDGPSLGLGWQPLEAVEKKDLLPIIALLPRRRREDSRKGRSREVVVRALAVSALSVRVGHRDAARRVIAWDGELGERRYRGDFDLATVAARRPANAIERQALQDEESHVLEAARETLGDLGLIRLSDVA